MPFDRPGEEPLDYRFSFANERTFLAWIRTALALLAGAVALARLPDLRHDRVARITSRLLVVAAGCIPPGALWRWHRNERAMRAKRGVASILPVALLAAVIVVVALLGIDLISK